MDKLCNECGEKKPTSEFHKDRQKADGFNAYCKPCSKIRNKRFAKRPPRHKSPEGMKRCSCCKETKSLAEFSGSANTYDGRDRRCKVCLYEHNKKWRLKNLDKAAAQQKRWRDANPERFKDVQRKKNYGVPLGWFAATFAAQDGVCAACGSADSGGKGDFHIDHCHESGKVRAILCGGCNLAIGHLRNDPEIADAVKRYLIKHAQ